MLLPPRLAAALTILLLIGGVAFALIGGTALAGTYLNGDVRTQHDAGKIVHVDDNMNFSLRIADGQVVSFECSGRCRAALPHMLRHEREYAATDVYYVRLANNVLMALDVD